MLPEIIKQFNWLDIAIVVTFLIICFSGIKNGFLAEVFKILGTVLGIYVSFHYYISLSDYLKEHLTAISPSIEFLDFFSFVVLACAGYLAFAAIRRLILHFIKMEAAPTLSKWGGFVLALARSFLFASLIIFMLVISSISYLKGSVVTSYSGKRLFNISPGLYSSIWNGVTSKFMTAEKFNQTVLEVQLPDTEPSSE